MNFYLIGYMGAGKTTVGKLLEEKMSMNFIDMDDFIEKQEGKSVADLFKIKGETAFREIEHQALLALSKKKNCIIATGGGVPCYHNNMQLMNATGKTFYLYFSPEMLMIRLKLTDLNTRPLLTGKTDEELLDFISKTLQKREPFYLESNYLIEGSDEEKSLIISSLVQSLIDNQ